MSHTSEMSFGGKPVMVEVAAVDIGMFGGTVKVNGVGAGKRVLVQDRRDMSYFASTHSLPDGSWTIKGFLPVEGANYTVTVFDDTGEFNAEVADHISMFVVAGA